jgi:uncharacterized protein (DUF2461 family)
MLRNPEEIQSVAASLKRKKLELEFEHSLSSMPRGFQNFGQTPIAPFLKLTSFVLARTVDKEDCHSPKLVDKIVKFAFDVKPLLDFGWRVEDSLPKSFPE